ncbi:hypothetical protein REPUB_Repub07fG0187100 [Reevesia pubescens]
MKREEKSEEGVAEKEENLCEKLSKRVLLVGNRKGGDPFTPPPSWKLYHPQSHLHHNNNNPPPAAVSARKLAASLWEFHQYHHPKMHRGGVNNSNGRYHQRLHNNNFKDKGIDFSHILADPCPSSDPDQPESASSLRRHIAQTLMKHHRSIEKNNHALQPVSPASYGSSMEVSAVTPSSSLDFRGRIGESHYNLKTSTELLKVLNRIWSLEEQHASNISLIKALKMELDHARVRIKELLRDQQAGRHEIDDLMKQIAEDKLVRKSKEQDRIHSAVQSVRNELEDERKLRKRSESLHRKLAREMSEAKASLANALKDLERERKSRNLLEDLCDEFARGIKSYEQEVHTLRQKSEDWTGAADHDRLILHISESWLDERMQIKLEEAQSGFAEQNSIVDKLGFEIETFLQAKQIGTSVSKRADYLSQRDRRKSLESVPLNEAVSAAKDVSDEEDSAGSDSNCFELNKPNIVDLKSHEDEAVNGDIEEIMKSNHAEKKLPSYEKSKSRHPSSLQVKFEEKMARAMCNGNKKSQLSNSEQENTGVGNTTEITVSQKIENDEATQYGSDGRKAKLDEIHGSSSNYVLDNLIRNHIALSEGGNINPENDCGEASCSFPPRRNQPSPVRQWMTKFTSHDLDVSESSTKLPPATKDNTLKAKLLEARSKGQRSRLKIFKGKS